MLKHCWKDVNKYFYNRTDDDFFDLFLGAVLNNSNYTIREKKMILNLFRNYHIQTLGPSKEKYPFELACAEILEVFRLFFNLEQDWEWEDIPSNVLLRSEEEVMDEDIDGELNTVDEGLSRCTLSIDVHRDFFNQKIEPVWNFFLEQSRKKNESVEKGLIPRGAAMPNDFVVAFFSQNLKHAEVDSLSEMSVAIENLKSDEEFRKAFDFFEAFRNKICV